MGFKRVVVLGGGPIGLFCAIEARTQLGPKSTVTVVEMRSDYSRMNVPVMDHSILKHMETLEIKKFGGKTTNVKAEALGTALNAPLSEIESALSKKAKSAGVRFKTGYVADDLVGTKPISGYNRFKQAIVTVRKWDHAKRRISTSIFAGSEALPADLLIVAIGGGGVDSKDFSKIKQTLDFEHSHLAAESYAAYAVFDKAKTAGSKAPSTAQTTAKPLGYAVPVETMNSQYLLLNLRGITPDDFRKLRGNTDELRRVMNGVGRVYKNDVVSSLDSADKAVGAFEVKIKRANHVLSPKFPAMLIGDAAATPHPQAGTGLLTGFHGFEAFQELLEALITQKAKRGSDEALNAFDDFERSYEAWIAAKALEGTIVTLMNLIGTMDAYLNKCANTNFGTLAHAAAILQANVAAATNIKTQFTAQRDRAKMLGGALQDSVNRPKNLASTAGNVQLSGTFAAPVTGHAAFDDVEQRNDSVSKLWADIKVTYDGMTNLLRGVDLLTNVFGQIETALTSANIPVPSFSKGKPVPA